MKHFNKITTFLLLAISLFLTGCGLEFNGENSIYEYNETDFIALSELSTCVDDIKNINIDWPKGNVAIQKDENLNVCIEITSDTDLDNELYLTRYKITDNTLFIKYCANGVNIGDFKEKSLKLIVPYKVRRSFN